MNLQDFVRETIVQITTGVVDADNAVAPMGAAVNPHPVARAGAEASHGFYGYLAVDEAKNRRRAVHCIDFDVAVSVSEGTETKGGIQVHVGVLGLGSAGKSDKANTSESRVRFSIPVLIPSSKNPF